MVHEKNWRVSLCVQELSSIRFSLNSCSHSGMSECHGSPVPVRDPHSYLVLGFRLVHVTTLLMFQM